MSPDPVRRPLIGISTYAEAASWGVWRDVPAAVLPWGYVDHVSRAGGQPVLLPPVQLDEETAGRVVAGLDGLIIAGGPDLDPDLYGQSPHPANQVPRPERDAAEMALVAAAVRVDLPLLGVCRGMQVMAVLAGGRLAQHLPDLVGGNEHSPAPGLYGSHLVRLVEGSLAHRLLGPEVLVPSYHHQGVLSYPGYRASGHAADRTVEAMEAPEARFRLGVQWHPEAGTDPRLFAGLVAAAWVG